MGRKFLKVMAVLVIVSWLGEGGTWTARISEKGRGSNSDYYKGVMTDLTKLGLHDLGYEALVCYLDVICPVVALLSLPVDVVVDTLLVPHDFSRASNLEASYYEKVVGQESYGFLGLEFSAPDGNADFERPIRYAVEYRKGNREYRLLVLDVPLKTAGAKIYIPFVKGYVPTSVSVTYGDVYHFEMVVALNGGTWGRESLKEPEVGGSDSPQMAIYTSGDGNIHWPKIQVVVTSFLNVKGVRLVTKPGYVPRGHGT